MTKSQSTRPPYTVAPKTACTPTHRASRRASPTELAPYFRTGQRLAEALPPAAFLWPLLVPAAARSEGHRPRRFASPAQLPNPPAETRSPTRSPRHRTPRQSGKAHAAFLAAAPKSLAHSQCAASTRPTSVFPAPPANTSARSASTDTYTRGSLPSPSKCAL